MLKIYNTGKDTNKFEEINTFDDYNVLSKQTIANIGDPIIREIIILPKKSDNLVKMEK